jgi:hypothetical protein
MISPLETKSEASALLQTHFPLILGNNLDDQVRHSLLANEQYGLPWQFPAFSARAMNNVAAARSVAY